MAWASDASDPKIAVIVLDKLLPWHPAADDVVLKSIQCSVSDEVRAANIRKRNLHDLTFAYIKTPMRLSALETVQAFHEVRQNQLDLLIRLADKTLWRPEVFAVCMRVHLDFCCGVRGSSSPSSASSTPN